MTRLYPLTRQQQGLWVEWKRDPNDISYNTCVQVEMEGELDLDRFMSAAQNSVDHFDMLRAYLVEKDLKPHLAFGEVKYELSFTDFSNGGSETKELRKKAVSFLDKIRLEPIPLDKFPLVNAHLVKTAKDKFYFIGVVPHLISDGVSAVMFLQSLSTCYNEGKEALKEKFSHDDTGWPQYLELCEEKYPKEKMDEAYEYWQEALAVSSHQVSIGGKPCNRSSNLGLRFQFDSNLEVFGKLRKIARANRTGLFSVISASLAAFISRYYAPEDLIVGYPVNLRPAGYRNAFGFYVNVLPLKVSFDEDDSFNALTKKAHDQRKLDKKYQYLPSIDIVRSRRKTDPNFDGQMFNISMAETVSRLQNLELDNIKSTSLDNETIEIKDDLSLIYEVSEEGISFWFEYLAEIFSEEKIAGMSRHFIRLLEFMADNPDEKISGFDILDEEEKRELLCDSVTAKSKGRNIVDEFRKSVARNADEVAVIFDEQKVSYLELDERSDSLAKYLFDSVDPKERFVALVMPYSVERIVAMLAVLKAGFAYLPIEEDTPLERIKVIIEDSGVENLLSVRSFNAGANNIILGDLDLEKGDFDAKISDLSYLIYTSGSTGKPKGVLIEQEKVVARVDWLKKEFALGAKDNVLQSTSYSFDVSVAEIFWPLLSGATLVVLDEEKRKDFRYQASLIQKHQITAACMVPSAIMALLKVVQEELPFKYLLSAGEAMSKELVDEYYKFGKQGSLYNVYGPTESVIYASFTAIAKGDAITIGKAVDGAELYVLNSALKMQPQGSVGELCVGGDVLSLGYLNRSDLTDEYFVDNPYSKGKLYRTGDLVSLDGDANVRYHGRMDSQVKIRGYRIEVGEIESRLLEINDVDEALVFVNDKSQLIAAIVSRRDVSDETIRKYLARFLPSYMVVQFIVRFESLPKLESGKLNKKLVKNIASNKIMDSVDVKELVFPKSEKEKIMAKIWSDILRINVGKIGVNNSFFELGGDSLMIIELECLAERQGIYLDTKMIFKDPTILGLLESASDEPLNKFNQDLVEGEVGLLPRQIKFFEDGFKNPAQWSRCVLVESKREIDVAKFKQSLKEVMDHHDALRVSFKEVDGKWVGYNHGSIDPVVNVYDFSPQDKKSAALSAKDTLNEELRGFDLAKAPLIKVVYLKFKRHYEIALIVHHLLLDMRSCRVILEDLMMNFMAKMSDQEFDFGYKTSSIGDYLGALNKHILEGDFEDEIKYWVGELRAVEDSRDITESEMLFEDISFDKKKTKKMLEFAVKNGVTLHETLLANFAKNYCRIFYKEEIVVNSCFHGRDDLLDGVKISKSVGWFNTVFPIKIEMSKGDIVAYLKQKFANIPARSLNYLPLRFIKKDKRLVELPEPKIFFNYVSKIDRELPGEISKKLPLKIIEGKGLEVISKDEKVCYELYVEAAIVDEKLEVKVGYLSDKYDVSDVKNLLNEQLDMFFTDRLKLDLA